MIRFTEKRIGRRIGAVIGLTMMAFGLGGLLLVLAQTAKTQEETEERMAHVLAETIAVSFQTFDARLGQHPIGDIAAELRAEEDILALEVFDDQGRVRWTADPRRKGAIVRGDILDAIRTATRAAGAQGPGADDPNAAETEAELNRRHLGAHEALASGDSRASGVTVPLRKTSSCLPCHNKSPDPIGGIHVAASHGKILGATEAFSRQAAASVFVFSVLITAFLFFLINRLVVSRLSKLVEVITKAEEGDFLVRAEVSSHDEIGLLASTFNKMLAKITDLRVEHIDKDREMHEVLDELELKAEIAKRGELLQSANERLNARLTQLSFIYDLGRDLASELELDALLDRIGELVTDSLGVPEFAVLLFDPASGVLNVAKTRGFAREEILSEQPIPLDQGLTGDAVRQHAPVYVPSVDSDVQELPYRIRRGSGSVLIVPAFYRDDLIAVLVFSSPVSDAFRAEERELFASIGNHAALALANAQLFQRTLMLSNTDGLTGILNRRAMESRLELEWSRRERDKSNLSLVLIDIDHFKYYNDQHGHQLGDETLRRVARLLERNVRKVDAVARYGGEEFVVILPRATKAEALEVANKLRRSVEQSDFVQGYLQPLGRVTISCGVASCPEDAESVAALITCADDALFRAKQSGRNQVVAFSKHRAPSFSRELPEPRRPPLEDDSAYFDDPAFT